MDSHCRICRRNELKHFFRLDYESDFYSITVLDMLQSLTGLEGALGDDLPQQICRMCMGTLAAGYDLKQLCIDSYAYFRRAIQINSQIPPKEEASPADEIDGIDLESCLTLEQIKVEPFVDADETPTDDRAEMNKTHKDTESEKTFYCCFPNCRINYQFEELLIEHAASDHQQQKTANEAKKSGDFEFICIVCAQRFRSEVKLWEHRNRKRRGPFTCSECGYQTETKALYREHVRAHKKKEKVCDCGYRTTITYSFKRHQAKCMPSRWKTQRQQKRNALQEHIAYDKTNEDIEAMGFVINRRPSMFYCCLSDCATVCLTQQQLNDHFEAAHPEVRKRNMEVVPENDNSVECPICSCMFPAKKVLQIHLEDAYAPTFRCNTCRYICNTRKTAILHASMPCVVKMHQCSCGYEAPKQFNLKRHMQVSGCPPKGSTLKHTAIKRRKSSNQRRQLHRCEYCEKAFSTPEILQRHVETKLCVALPKQEAHACHDSEKTAYHFDQQLFICIKCQKRFQQYDQYMEHTTNLVCSIESCLSCKYCDARFSNQKELVRHLAEQHLRSDRFNSAKPYECEDCLQSFGTRYSLRRHRINLHGVVEEASEKKRKDVK